MKRILMTLLATAAFALSTSAQSLVGIWRWTTEPGAHKFLEFKQNGKVKCRDYATFTIEDGHTVTVSGWLRWEGTYTHKGNTLTITNLPATAKAEIIGLEVYPEVSQNVYNQIRTSIAKQLNQSSAAGISSKPQRYTIEHFTNDHLQMLIDDDTAQYFRVGSYSITE